MLQQKCCKYVRNLFIFFMAIKFDILFKLKILTQSKKIMYQGNISVHLIS